MNRHLVVINISVSLIYTFLLSGCSSSKGNIMVTGYWPTTNEMLRDFSTDKSLNPDGWQGRNWRGSGYDVYSYFPTFPEGTEASPAGKGDFMVDYQVTESDFRRVTDTLCPVAIISFGIGAGEWEIEYNAVIPESWHEDYIEPRVPVTSDEWMAIAGGTCRSTLPVEAIEKAVNDTDTGIEAWVDWEGDPGDFLCNYIAMLGCRYRQAHSGQSDGCGCLAAGFIHVGPDVSVEEAREAAMVTLQTTIEYLESLRGR